ncbi:MAG: multi-sensor hybrid histidine kinase [Comamonadaceae bacterium]|nr:MAG: multi-sensor hybrid histidine kinase [Comamonadaceae bacterium]
MQKTAHPSALTVSVANPIKHLVTSVVLINVIAIVMVAFSLYRSYHQVLAHAEVATQNLAIVLSSDIGAVIDKVDLGLRVASENVEKALASGHPDAQVITADLTRLQSWLPQVMALRVTDEQGWAKYGLGVPQNDRVNLADRGYFSQLRDNPDTGLFINKPVISKINKVWVMNFARRLNHPDGRFAGVVFANIALDNFSKMFASIDVGAQGVINLRYADMGLLVRHPAPPDTDLADVINNKTISPEFRQALTTGRSSGTFFTPTSFDNTARVVSFQKINTYPLFITVGIAKSSYLAAWQREALQMSGLVLLLVLGSSAAARVIARIWTRQLDATHQLAREEEKFHTVADYTYDWEYWESSRYEVLYMSAACERTTGYSVAEFVADPGLLLRVVHPDDLQLMKEHVHDAQNTGLASVDFRIVRRDGEIRWISHCCQAVYDHQGGYMGRRVTNRDMTDRHLFEAEINRLSQAVEQNPTGILIVDTQGQLSYSNQAYTRMTGFSFPEAYRKPLRDLISTEMTDVVFADIQARLQAGKLWAGILPNRHKDGALRWEQVSASPIYDEHGNISCYLYLRTDITELKHNEEELRRYKDHLEEEVQQRTTELVLARNAAETANHAKSVFLANMSHELRTPLNAILGFSNMMRNDPHLPPGLLQNVGIINRSGEHLLVLINDVLEMAKIEAGRVVLENAPFDLGAMVRDVTDMMNVRALEKGLRLMIDQSSCFPRYITGDEARLRQILINLLGNAIKFTQEGGVTVRLGTQNNRITHLLIEVEDSGIGISTEDQQRIFEPFVQLGQQGDGKGTGLGLTITRQFAQLMGGQLSLESVPGKGSLFRVELPLHEVAQADIAKPEVAGTGAVVGRVPGQPDYRILIIEDQLENQLLLVKLMELIGLPVRVADNGQQGVEMFQSWHPHLIWMDRHMPVMDGMEAMRQIRRLPGGTEVKIVAVTASAFKEQRSEMLAAGMDDFVRKPYRFNEIYESLAQQLGVQYIYEGVPATQETVALTAEMLAVLPQALRQQLKAALESLENEQIEQVIRAIAAYDKPLEKTLTQLIQNFDYPAVLKALDTSQANE